MVELLQCQDKQAEDDQHPGAGVTGLEEFLLQVVGGIAVGEVSVDRIFMGLLILIPVTNTTKASSTAALNRPG